MNPRLVVSVVKPWLPESVVPAEVDPPPLSLEPVSPSEPVLLLLSVALLLLLLLFVDEPRGATPAMPRTPPSPPLSSSEEEEDTDTEYKGGGGCLLLWLSVLLPLRRRRRRLVLALLPPPLLLPLLLLQSSPMSMRSVSPERLEPPEVVETVGASSLPPRPLAKLLFFPTAHSSILSSILEPAPPTVAGALSDGGNGWRCPRAASRSLASIS